MSDDQTGPSPSADARVVSTPDNERAERLAPTRRLLASIERYGAETQAEDYLAGEVASLLAEVARLDATIRRIRDALANHPRACDKYGKRAAITCGWKYAVADIEHALDPQEPTS